MKRVLFLYWHGLGDNILATPAIKAYKTNTNNYIGWAMLRRFQSAKLFEENPYIDQLHWISDAWNDFGTYSQGSKEVIAEGEKIKNEYGYDELRAINHKSSNKHKIHRTADEMGIRVENVHTEIYYSYKKIAHLYNETRLPEKYVFFHGQTGVANKNLSIDLAKEWLEKNKIGLPVISPDFTWDIRKYPISFAMDVMKKAQCIIVADSVMYHAAHAMDLRVDLAFFARGKSVWQQVRPLHSNNEYVAYDRKTCLNIPKKKSYKLIFVGVFNKESTNVSQAVHFENLGVKVIRYNYRDVAKEIGDEKRDSDLIELCQREKPDFVLFSKCNEIDIQVVHQCNKVCKTVLWYMDPKNNNYNNLLVAKIKNCTFSCMALTKPYEESKKYSRDVYFLQEGFDPAVDTPVDVDYKHDVSFIGNLRGERAKYYQNVRFHNYTSVYGREHAVAVGESKINLNFTEGGTSDRTYKILAAKGFLLTQPWPGMEYDFKIGRDFDIFNSIDELKEKINFYLKESGLRNKIAEQGYETVQKFSRFNFAKRFLKIFENYR